MFDRASNDVAFSARDNVCYTVTGVDDSSSECAVRNLVGGPGRCKCEDCLHSDIKTLYIEGFEEDLGSLFSVLRRIQRRLGLQKTYQKNELCKADKTTAHQKEVVILRLSPQILEDGLLPVSLHVVPIINHTVSDGIMDAVSRCFRVGKGFIADEEVEVFHSTFRCEVTGFRGNSGCTRRLGGGTARGNRSWEYTG